MLSEIDSAKNEFYKNDKVDKSVSDGLDKVLSKSVADLMNYVDQVLVGKPDDNQEHVTENPTTEPTVENRDRSISLKEKLLKYAVEGKITIKDSLLKNIEKFDNKYIIILLIK